MGTPSTIDKKIFKDSQTNETSKEMSISGKLPQKEDPEGDFIIDMAKKAERRKIEMDQKHAKEFTDVLAPDELVFASAMNSGQVPKY